MSQQSPPSGTQQYQATQQQYQPPYQSNRQFGSGLGQRQEMRELRQEERQEIRQAVMTLQRLETVLELAQMRAIETQHPRAARLSGDLVTLVEAEKKLIVRRSPFAEPIGQAAKQTLQQGLQELRQTLNVPEVQEALSEVQQSTNAIDRAHSIIQASEAASAAGFEPMYGPAHELGGGLGQFQQNRQFRQDVRQTAMTLGRFETALEVARVRALENGRIRVARLCGDLAVVAELEKKLVVRRSPFAEPIGQAVKQTIQQGVQELRQAADDPDVQEALSEAQPAIEAIQNAVSERYEQSHQGQPQFGQNQPQSGQNQPQFGQNQPQFGQNQPQSGQNQPQSGQSQWAQY